MNEQYWAEQFSSEVDGLLSEPRQVPAGMAPPEYVEALEMARVLAALDFSVESRRRDTLRRRLLAGAYHSPAARGRSSIRAFSSALPQRVQSFVGKSSVGVFAHRLWLLVRSQARVVRHEIWTASALVMLLGLLVTLSMSQLSSPGYPLPLVFVAPIVAALGIAFLFGLDVDPALEIELATPVSPRTMLLTRLVLVFGFDLGLGMMASTALAWSVPGVSLWPLVMTWLAPMAFLSALAFVISVLFAEPALGMLVSLALWIAHSARWMMVQGGVPWPIPDLTSADARPWMWLLALLLVGLGLWIGGHEERWLRRQG